MALLAAWRAGQEHRHRVERFVGVLLEEPASAEVAWLATLSGDVTAARREWQLLRCALGVIVAEQDALADRTAADIAHQLGLPIRSGLPEQRAGWALRRRQYADALAVRGTREGPTRRLASVLLRMAGATDPDAGDLDAAAERIADLRARLNEALRSVFGQVVLPDHLPPSALRR